MNRSADHVKRNRAEWDSWASDMVAPGEKSWASEEPNWGIWGVPESQVRMLPADLEGRDTIELGCGTAYVSAWMARRGARPVGIDNSSAQLATARRFQRKHSLVFPLIHGNAEQLPFPDESFDVAISEYGASIWADPYLWIPEASRVLRRGGRLTFLVNSTILMLCMPDLEDEKPTDRMLRDYFGMHRFEWPDDDSVEFHLGYGDWIRLFHDNGLEVEDLIEVRPPEGGRIEFEVFDSVPYEWARRWPSEEIWKARKRA